MRVTVHEVEEVQGRKSGKPYRRVLIDVVGLPCFVQKNGVVGSPIGRGACPPAEPGTWERVEVWPYWRRVDA